MKFTTWIIAGVFVTGFGQAGLAAECVADAPPICIEGSGYFDDKDAEKSCREALKNYQKSVRAFWDCQREKGNTVNDEERNVVRQFNCRIRGKETCE